MNKDIKQTIKDFIADEDGQDTTEYTLLLGLIAVALIFILGFTNIVQTIIGKIASLWQDTSGLKPKQ